MPNQAFSLHPTMAALQPGEQRPIRNLQTPDRRNNQLAVTRPNRTPPATLPRRPNQKHLGPVGNQSIRITTPHPTSVTTTTDSNLPICFPITCLLLSLLVHFPTFLVFQDKSMLSGVGGLMAKVAPGAPHGNKLHWYCMGGVVKHTAPAMVCAKIASAISWQRKVQHTTWGLMCDSAHGKRVGARLGFFANFSTLLHRVQIG